MAEIIDFVILVVGLLAGKVSPHVSPPHQHCQNMFAVFFHVNSVFCKPSKQKISMIDSWHCRTECETVKVLAHCLIIFDHQSLQFDSPQSIAMNHK